MCGFTVSKWPCCVTVWAHASVRNVRSCFLFPSPASAPWTEACKDMHAFILKWVRRKKCEECLLIYPVWAKPTEPPSCVWCKYVAVEQLIETNHSISTSNFSQLVNLLPFLLLYLSLNLSSNLTVWVRNLDFFFLLEQNLFPLNALPAAAKSPKRSLWNRIVDSFFKDYIRLFLLIASATQSISTLSLSSAC